MECWQSLLKCWLFYCLEFCWINKDYNAVCRTTTDVSRSGQLCWCFTKCGKTSTYTRRKCGNDFRFGVKINKFTVFVCASMREWPSLYGVLGRNLGVACIEFRCSIGFKCCPSAAIEDILAQFEVSWTHLKLFGTI